MRLQNARALSAAQSAVNKLNKLLPALISDPRADGFNDLTNDLTKAASRVVCDEIAGMSTMDIIKSAGSIQYYGRKFGLKG